MSYSPMYLVAKSISIKEIFIDDGDVALLNCAFNLEFVGYVSDATIGIYIEPLRKILSCSGSDGNCILEQLDAKLECMTEEVYSVDIQALFGRALQLKVKGINIYRSNPKHKYVCNQFIMDALEDEEEGEYPYVIGGARSQELFEAMQLKCNMYMN